jgi:hypothetical protein
MADRIGVRVSWLCREAEARRVPGIKAGHVWHFDPAAVEAVIRQRAGVIAQTDHELPRLISLKQLADLTLWTPQQLRRLVAEGRLRGFIFGRHVLVQQDYGIEAAQRLFIDRHSPNAKGRKDA